MRERQRDGDHEQRDEQPGSPSWTRPVTRSPEAFDTVTIAISPAAVSVAVPVPPPTAAATYSPPNSAAAAALGGIAK
ncbi:hypothetical protein [Microbispora sp. GKU 823]|uniref:hypothetical protein n=1 Tax=Microbispora sp. GKU 823 TaxID=1652100 RepID=UPI001C4DEC79|nr:hypothetical protein [Microbispora sp. GKU 823]